MNGRFKWLPGMAPALLLTALAGCMPARQPAPPEADVAPPAQWHDAERRETAISATWWKAFDDPQLTALVEAALRTIPMY